MRFALRHLALLAFAVCHCAHANEALAEKAGCLACHKVDTAATAPTFRAVAQRYRNDPQARELLVKKVKFGSRGNWIEVSKGAPMPPHSNLVLGRDIELLVDWILQL